MELKNVGYNYKHPSDILLNRPQGSGDYVFLLFKSPFIIKSNGRIVKKTTTSIFIYNKGTPQYYGGINNTDEQFINDWFHFTMDDDDLAFLSRLGISLDTVYELYDVSFFSHIIKQLSYEYHSTSPYKDAILRLYFELIFTKLADIVNSSKSDDLNPLYEEFVKLRTTIQNHPLRDWKIDDIAGSFALSRSRVQHLYKNFFNTSITADVMKYRMERAQYYLYNYTNPIEEIATIVGYDQPSNFIRQFKKSFGVTPSKYRKQTRRSLQYFKFSKEYDLTPCSEDTQEESN